MLSTKVQSGLFVFIYMHYIIYHYVSQFTVETLFSQCPCFLATSMCYIPFEKAFDVDYIRSLSVRPLKKAYSSFIINSRK